MSRKHWKKRKLNKEELKRKLYRQKIQIMRPIDNRMFQAIFCYSEEIARDILKVVLNRDPGELVFMEKENTLDPGPAYKGVRLDCFAVDAEGNAFDFESQLYRIVDTDGRILYYHSVITVTMTVPGTEYSAIGKTTVVFFTNYDPWNTGHAMYEEVPAVYAVVNGKREFVGWNDRQKSIILNTEGNLDELTEEQRNLAQFEQSGIPCDELTGRMAKVMKKIKRVWSENLLALTHEMFSNQDHYNMGHDAGVEEGFGKGLAQGESQGELKTYAGLVNDGTLDISVAAEKAGMTTDEFKKNAGKYLA